MQILLLVIAVGLSCGKSLLYRSVSALAGEPRSFWLANALSFVAAAGVLVLFQLVSGGPGMPSLRSVLLAVPFAAANLLSQVLYIRAQKRGPVSLNTFLYSCGFVIPTLFGVLYNRELICLSQVVGLLLLFPVLYLYLLPKKGTFDARWLLTILGAALSSGLVGVIQKLHQLSPAAEEMDGFLLMTFLLCAGGSLGLCLRYPRDGEGAQKKYAACALSVGVVNSLLNRVNLVLVGLLPSMIFYPVFNGGATLAAGIAAFLFCHEKINLRQLLCILAGTGAISLISKLIAF